MPRVRDRKTKNGLYSSPDVFARAYQALVEGQTVRGAAALFGVPYTTFHRYVQRRGQNSTAPEPGYNPHNKVFSAEQEGSLRDYLLKASEIYYGLSPREVRRLAYQLAKKHNCAYPKTWEANQLAGKDWFTAFLVRNQQLSIRRPQATSLSRATSFNPTNVGNFFANLTKVLDQHHFQAQDVWNADETSTVTVQVPDKIIASRGTKQVGAMTSAERGTLVTMALAVNAMGNSIPPHFVFPRKIYHDHFVRDGPTGCIGSCSGSGWMQEGDFQIFLRHFVRYTRASPESKVLLLLDNHVSHLSLEGIDYCRANGVVLLSFPPHCSHKLQPLDRSVYGPLKRYMNSAMDRWMMGHAGKTMTIYDLPGIVATALPFAATPSNIMAGFKCTGIWPFNPTIFTMRDFSPAYVTDRPAPLPTSGEPAPAALDQSTTVPYTVEPPAPDQSVGRPTTSAVEGFSPAPDEYGGRPTTSAVEGFSPAPDESGGRPTTSAVEGFSPAPDESGGRPTTSAIEGFSPAPDESGGRPTTSAVASSWSCTAEAFSPEGLRPFPKAGPRSERRGRRRSTAILTDTPVKRALEEEKAKQKPKAKRKLAGLRKEPAKPAKRAKHTKSPAKRAKPTKSPDVDDPECIVCVETFTSSRPGEVWVRCMFCEGWAHEACTEGGSIYVCHNCEME